MVVICLLFFNRTASFSKKSSHSTLLVVSPPMAMWRAAARHLVDRALGSRAAHTSAGSKKIVGVFYKAGRVRALWWDTVEQP